MVLSWDSDSISFSSGDFIATDSGEVLPSGTTPGARYQVAALRSHLGVPESEMVFYAHDEFLDNPLTESPQSFSVTLPSTDPRMLVYAIAKSMSSKTIDFDMKVPPSIPGFVVPELGPIFLAIASFSAFALYAVKRRKLAS